MSSSEILARIRRVLAARIRAYGLVVVALLFNIPFLVAALSRYPEGLNWSGLGGVYVGLVFLGYYVLILLVLLAALLLALGVRVRLFVGASGALLALVLYYFVLEGLMYRVFRMHIDAFWLQYLFTTFGGVGIGVMEVVAALALLAVVIALEWWVFRLAGRVRVRKPWAIGLAAVAVLAFTASQTLHIAAYEANDVRITSITPELPFYYPVTSHQNAQKYGGQLGIIREADGTDGERRSLVYPLADVSCDTAPGQP